jgi:hypothetical protein
MVSKNSIVRSRRVSPFRSVEERIMRSRASRVRRVSRTSRADRGHVLRHHQLELHVALVRQSLVRLVGLVGLLGATGLVTVIKERAEVRGEKG